MGEFFKPWRRKIGVVTLVLACVFMGGWVRSYSFTDQLIPPGQTSTFHVWVSLRGRFAWMKVQGQAARVAPSLPMFSSAPGNSPCPIDREYSKWYWQFMGFGSGTGNAHIYLFWTIPYWSIVVPLTLLSAWLLLSKPRAKKIEPTASKPPNDFLR